MGLTLHSSPSGQGSSRHSGIATAMLSRTSGTSLPQGNLEAKHTPVGPGVYLIRAKVRETGNPLLVFAQVLYGLRWYSPVGYSLDLASKGLGDSGVSTPQLGLSSGEKTGQGNLGASKMLASATRGFPKVRTYPCGNQPAMLGLSRKAATQWNCSGNESTEPGSVRPLRGVLLQAPAKATGKSHCGHPQALPGDGEPCMVSAQARA